MSGANLAVIALWVAIALTGLTAGVLASRWNDPDRRASAQGERLLLAGAAASVIAWCAHAGTLAGGASASALLVAHVPVDVGAGFRLAVLWATLPGAALTLAAVLLVASALSQQSSGADRMRFAAVAVSAALVALGVSAWFMPGAGPAATVIPPFVQSSPASLAPLFALLAIGGLALLVAWAVARTEGAPVPRALLLATWTAATAAVALEQMARSRLGIGPREVVVLGSASSGLILWLGASALVHQRVQAFLLRVPLTPAGPRARPATLLGHAGAICVVVSFALHAFASRSNVVLPPGKSVGVTDAFRRTWQLVNQGVSEFDAAGVDVTALAVEARDPGGRVRLLAPEIREFHGRNGEHLEIPTSVRRETGRFTQTMRVLLTGTDSLDVARVRVTFLPVPILWPIGIALLGLSAILAFSTPPATDPRSTST